MLTIKHKIELLKIDLSKSLYAYSELGKISSKLSSIENILIKTNLLAYSVKIESLKDQIIYLESL